MNPIPPSSPVAASQADALRPAIPPPPAPAPPLFGPPSGLARAYRSPWWPATLLRWSLVGCVVAAAANAAASVVEYRLLGRLIDAPTSIAPAALAAADQRRVVLMVALLVASVVSYVLLAAWTGRLYRNLASLGIRGLRFTEGWGVGAWFVPLLNLVRPKQILNDIWRGSEPGAAGDGWHSNRVSPLLHWWWATWLGSWVLYRSTDLAGNDPATVREGLISEVIAAALLVLSAVLAMIAVRRLTHRQTEQAATRPAVAQTEAPDSVAKTPRRHQFGSAADWLAPIVGIVGFASALVLFDLPDSRGGSRRAERADDGSVASQGGVLVNNLQVGDCFNDPAALTPVPPGELVEVVGLEVLPCGEPHDSEVFALLEHPGGSTADFPGEATVSDFAVEHCVEQFQAWVGIPFEESVLDITFLMPHAEGWRAGDRGIICVTRRVDSQKLDAPVRHTGI